MQEPPQDRSLSSLAPIMRGPFDAWLKRAQAEAAHVKIFPTETRRSSDRQKWLWKHGREPPYQDHPKRTWTLDSRHRWGLAVDLAMQRGDGSLIWEANSWAWLFRVSELETYGLRNLAPLEYVHVEAYYADEMIANADVHGLVQS